MGYGGEPGFFVWGGTAKGKQRAGIGFLSEPACRRFCASSPASRFLHLAGENSAVGKIFRVRSTEHPAHACREFRGAEVEVLGELGISAGVDELQAALGIAGVDRVEGAGVHGGARDEERLAR